MNDRRAAERSVEAVMREREPHAYRPGRLASAPPTQPDASKWSTVRPMSYGRKSHLLHAQYGVIRPTHPASLPRNCCALASHRGHNHWAIRADLAQLAEQR